jgi:uncharacterized membrane protein required for colicin V production
MADKKAMHQAVLIQFLGLLCIGGLSRIIGGLFGMIIGLVVGIGLIIFGARKYREAKKQ